MGFLGRQLVSALVARNDTPIQNGAHETDLWSACKVGNIEYVESVIRNTPELLHLQLQGRTPLYHACHCGHYDLVQRLLQAGATDDEFRSCHRAALTPEIRRLLQQYTAVEQFLLEMESRNCNPASIAAVVVPDNSQSLSTVPVNNTTTASSSFRKIISFLEEEIRSPIVATEEEEDHMFHHGLVDSDFFLEPEDEEERGVVESLRNSEFPRSLPTRTIEIADGAVEVQETTPPSSTGRRTRGKSRVFALPRRWNVPTHMQQEGAFGRIHKVATARPVQVGRALPQQPKTAPPVDDEIPQSKGKNDTSRTEYHSITTDDHEVVEDVLNGETEVVLPRENRDCNTTFSSKKKKKKKKTLLQLWQSIPRRQRRQTRGSAPNASSSSSSTQPPAWLKTSYDFPTSIIAVVEEEEALRESREADHLVEEEAIRESLKVENLVEEEVIPESREAENLAEKEVIPESLDHFAEEEAMPECLEGDREPTTEVTLAAATMVPLPTMQRSTQSSTTTRSFETSTTNASSKRVLIPVACVPVIHEANALAHHYETTKLPILQKENALEKEMNGRLSHSRPPLGWNQFFFGTSRKYPIVPSESKSFDTVSTAELANLPILPAPLDVPETGVDGAMEEEEEEQKKDVDEELEKDRKNDAGDGELETVNDVGLEKRNMEEPENKEDEQLEKDTELEKEREQQSASSVSARDVAASSVVSAIAETTSSTRGGSDRPGCTGSENTAPEPSKEVLWQMTLEVCGCVGEEMLLDEYSLNTLSFDAPLLPKGVRSSASGTVSALSRVSGRSKHAMTTSSIVEEMDEPMKEEEAELLEVSSQSSATGSESSSFEVPFEVSVRPKAAHTIHSDQSPDMDDTTDTDHTSLVHRGSMEIRRAEEAIDVSSLISSESSDSFYRGDDCGSKREEDENTLTTVASDPTSLDTEQNVELVDTWCGPTCY